MIVPIVIAGLAGVTFFHGETATTTKGYGVMTPERNHLYQSALRSKTLTPEQLRFLADNYEKQGLKAEGALLRKRALLRELPAEQRKQRKLVFRKACKSSDPELVEKLANIYEAQGATGSANTLRMIAVGLRNAANVKPVTTNPDEPDTVAPKDVEQSETENGQSASN